MPWGRLTPSVSSPGSIACSERTVMNETTSMRPGSIFGPAQIAWQIASAPVRLLALWRALMIEWVEMLGVRTSFAIVQRISNWIRPGCCVQILARSIANPEIRLP
ncbi:MAG: hypothetical protein ACYTBW_01240 [Planctomycetota bacterium]|jgi:hypothetical protein